MQPQPLKIIAGPCSIDDQNLAEIKQIAALQVKNHVDQFQPAIWGTRVVGLKSRTTLDPVNGGMGMDYETIVQNMGVLHNGGRVKDLILPPSVILAKELVAKTHLVIATEIMLPLLQLPLLVKHIPVERLFAWNPAVNQLGWSLLEMAQFMKRGYIGIKNGKWVGEHIVTANSATFEGKTTMEKTWEGLVSFAKTSRNKVVLIHRGVDVPEKQDYRNLPVHHLAQRVKDTTSCELFFDPSHSYGPKMRGNIMEATIAAMKLKISDGSFLYDGILIEAGTSRTDTEQHISLSELNDLVQALAQFRTLAYMDSKKIV